MHSKIIPLYAVRLDFDVDQEPEIFPAWMQGLAGAIRTTAMGRSPYLLMRHVARMTGFSNWRTKEPNANWMTLVTAAKDQLKICSAILLRDPAARLHNRPLLHDRLLTLAGAVIVEARRGNAVIGWVALQHFQQCYEVIQEQEKRTASPEVHQDLTELKLNLLLSIQDMLPLFHREPAAWQKLDHWLRDLKMSEKPNTQSRVSSLLQVVESLSE